MEVVAVLGATPDAVVDRIVVVEVVAVGSKMVAVVVVANRMEVAGEFANRLVAEGLAHNLVGSSLSAWAQACIPVDSRKLEPAVEAALVRLVCIPVGSRWVVRTMPVRRSSWPVGRTTASAC